MLIETLSIPFRLARSVDCTNASFNNLISLSSSPPVDTGSATAGAAIKLGAGGEYAQNSIQVIPYGVGSSTNTFNMQVVAWKPAERGNSGAQFDLWVPHPLVQVVVTLGTSPGVAGTPVDNTHLFATTITVTWGSTLSGEAPSENIVSPGSNYIAHIVVALKGAKYYEILFGTGSSATACNALCSLI